MTAVPSPGRIVRAEFREEPCKTALNRVKGMGFSWSLNPYTGCQHRCTYCYVRNFEQRAERASGHAYGRSVRVKTNVAEVLRREVSRRSWKRESVAIGAATDPYQPAEGTYRLTRRCIQVLGASRTPFTIVTRGPMIIRDIDVLTEAASRAEVSVHVSVPTLDEEIWRRTEPGTAPPRQRLKAVRMLVDAGIRAGIGVAPILPGLTDTPDRLLEVVRAAREAGATHLWGRMLYLKPGTREHFLEQLGRDWPEELERYQRMYRGPNLGRDRTEASLARVHRIAREVGIADRRRHRLVPPPPEEQLALFAVGDVPAPPERRRNVV